MKKILVLNANPKSSSFCHAIAQTYVAAVGDQVEVELLHLANLQFQRKICTRVMINHKR